MKTNPFVYGKEVSGENFYDRREDFESLVATLAGGSANVVLYAPRRYGKTRGMLRREAKNIVFNPPVIDADTPREDW